MNAYEKRKQQRKDNARERRKRERELRELAKEHALRRLEDAKQHEQDML